MSSYAIFRACGRVHRLLDMREFWIDASANTSLNKLSHNSCSPTVDSTIFQSTFTPQTIRQNASRDEQQQVQISRRQGRQPAGRGRKESTRPGSQGRCLQGGDEKVTKLALRGGGKHAGARRWTVRSIRTADSCFLSNIV